MPAGIVRVECFWCQRMPKHALFVVSRVKETPQYLHELFEGSRDTPVLPLKCSRGPWEAPIPPWGGHGVKGHRYTSTDLLPGHVGGPNTSLRWCQGQGTPLYPHEVSPGARGQPQYRLELFLGSGGIPIAVAPYPHTPRTYTAPNHHGHS